MGDVAIRPDDRVISGQCHKEVSQAMALWMIEALWLGPVALIFLFMVYAQVRVQRTYAQYRGVQNSFAEPGGAVARILLDSVNLRHIPVAEIDGQLTDHYDEDHKAIRLSTRVVHESSVASLAIAAHEVGHAIQHYDEYPPFRFRRYLMPIIAFFPPCGFVLLLCSIVMQSVEVGLISAFMLIIAVLLAFTLFPTEHNANRRALDLLRANRLLDSTDLPGINAIFAIAPLTYFAVLLASARHLVYLGLSFTGVARHQDN